jgi:hypothetical protein
MINFQCFLRKQSLFTLRIITLHEYKKDLHLQDRVGLRLELSSKRMLYCAQIYVFHSVIFVAVKAKAGKSQFNELDFSNPGCSLEPATMRAVSRPLSGAGSTLLPTQGNENPSDRLYGRASRRKSVTLRLERLKPG